MRNFWDTFETQKRSFISFFNLPDSTFNGCFRDRAVNLAFLLRSK